MKLADEAQGKQHYEPVERFGGKRGFKRLRLRDKRKWMACLRHGVRLIRVPYWTQDVEAYLRKRLGISNYRSIKETT